MVHREYYRTTRGTVLLTLAGSQPVRVLVRHEKMKQKRKSMRLVILAAVCIVLSGCGTVSTLTEGGKSMNPTFIYSGVRAEGPAVWHSGEMSLPWWQKALIVVDIPFSFCADTVVLPYTIYRTVTEPRKIAVRFLDQRDGGPGFIVQSDMTNEWRQVVPASEVCAVLKSITGKPRCVEVVILDAPSFSVSDFGIIYETVTSNQTLTLCYIPTHTNLLVKYLEERKANQISHRTVVPRRDNVR